MPWFIMLSAVLMIIVYILLIVACSDDVSKYHPIVQFVIVLSISSIYLFGALLYFITKYPTLF